MGRNSNIPPLFEDRKSIKLNVLKQSGFFETNTIKSGKYSWTRNGENFGSIEVFSNTISDFIRLKYIDQESIEFDYMIDIVRKPSNLGKGELLFFKCPVTNNLCRKLYLINGKFLNLKAAKGYYYYQQTVSKRFRGMVNYYENDELYRKLYSKYFKKYYKGKPTKQFIKLSKKIIYNNQFSSLEKFLYT